VQYKVYYIGHPLKHTPVGDKHVEVFAKQKLPITYERTDVPPVNFHRVMTQVMREPNFLGMKVTVPYKQTALAYCQEVSTNAQSIGSVNTLVKRPSGLVYGHNTDVSAFVQCLKEQGVKRVRTALILGAGGAARVALAGLRELGCARYLVGYRRPRRPTELSSQFKGIRRQISYFPIQEMTDFFSWADSSELFRKGPTLPPPNVEVGNSADGIKRWDLLVNATPVGQPPHADQALTTNISFLRCFARVLDFVPAADVTLLIEKAREAGVPAVQGYRIFELQAEYSREIWIKQYRRRRDTEPGYTRHTKKVSGED
jgi:shikimate 5-dehydrogenase